MKLEKMTQEATKIQEEMEQVRQSKETDEKAIEELQGRIDNFDAERKAAEKKSAQLVCSSSRHYVIVLLCKLTFCICFLLFAHRSRT